MRTSVSKENDRPRPDAPIFLKGAARDSLYKSEPRNRLDETPKGAKGAFFVTPKGLDLKKRENTKVAHHISTAIGYYHKTITKG